MSKETAGKIIKKMLIKYPLQPPIIKVSVVYDDEAETVETKLIPPEWWRKNIIRLIQEAGRHNTKRAG